MDQILEDIRKHSKSIKNNGTISSYIELGKALLKLNKYDEADSIFYECIKKFPTNQLGFELHAYTAMLKGLFEQAEKRYLLICKTFPQSKIMYLYLSACLIVLGKDTEARSLITQCSKCVTRDIFKSNIKDISDLLYDQNQIKAMQKILHIAHKIFPNVGFFTAYFGRRASQDIECQLTFVLANHIAKHKAHLAITTQDNLDTLKNRQYEKHDELKQKQQLWGNITDNVESYRNALIDPGYIKTKLGIMTADITSPLINVRHGERKTHYSPNEYRNILYFTGNSRAFSCFVEDKHTIQSFLQKKIVEGGGANDFYVKNIATSGLSLIDCVYQILALPLKEGDVVCLHGLELELVKKIKLSFIESGVLFIHCQLSKRPDGFDYIFVDNGHVSYKGTYLIAEQIYEKLFKPNNNGIKPQLPIPKNLPKLDNRQLAQAYLFLDLLKEDYSRSAEESLKQSGLHIYLKEISKLPIKSGIRGSIVMNCNPFTLGHQHIIEYAAKKVDTLVVFILEEDRSYFSFKDRIKLVKEGTKHLDNVIVAPSGRFIISTDTMPEYFDKNAPKTTQLDASKDLDIFGEYICSALGITIRFIGEEPFCTITKQYNEQMKILLPRYGVKVEEICRKEQDGQAISATNVRKLLKHKSFEKIKKLVPEITYNFLTRLS